ncbi:MAG: class I SAM-dependent methyltransferase [Rubripirellula sp.]
MSETDRFEFGKNWKAFLASLDQQRIERAVESLRQTLGVESMEGKRFLDLGCGSGLFSLAAHQLGAEVTSIDFDMESVQCTEFLRDNYAAKSPVWKIRQGSVLDASFLESLGQGDFVYSWGVLHHTGAMQEAIALASERTRVGGHFLISIYNDQGGASRRWLRIKQSYNRLPSWLRPGLVFLVASYYELKFAIARLLHFKNPSPRRDWQAKKADRGMSAWHDWVDWVGGLPFEVAQPEQIIEPLRQRGFILEKLKTVGNGWGCNEYLFTRQ